MERYRQAFKDVNLKINKIEQINAFLVPQETLDLKKINLETDFHFA